MNPISMYAEHHFLQLQLSFVGIIQCAHVFAP